MSVPQIRALESSLHATRESQRDLYRSLASYEDWARAAVRALEVLLKTLEDGEGMAEGRIVEVVEKLKGLKRSGGEEYIEGPGGVILVGPF